MFSFPPVSAAARCSPKLVDPPPPDRFRAPSQSWVEREGLVGKAHYSLVASFDVQPCTALNSWAELRGDDRTSRRNRNDFFFAAVVSVFFFKLRLQLRDPVRPGLPGDGLDGVVGVRQWGLRRPREPGRRLRTRIVGRLPASRAARRFTGQRRRHRVPAAGTGQLRTHLSFLPVITNKTEQ